MELIRLSEIPNDTEILNYFNNYNQIYQRYQQIQGKSAMSTNVDVPDLTDNKEVNNQLIMYFWWLILLTFASQLIGYAIQYFSGTITLIVLGILALGSVNTLLIGGGVKLVQKQIVTITDKYNASVKKQKQDASRIEALENENNLIKKQLNDRDGELIALKTKQPIPDLPVLPKTENV